MFLVPLYFEDFLALARFCHVQCVNSSLSPLATVNVADYVDTLLVYISMRLTCMSCVLSVVMYPG